MSVGTVGTPRGRRAAWLLALIAAACAPARHRVEGSVVRDIHLEGNGGWLSGQGDYLLRGAIEQRPSRFGLVTWPLSAVVEPSILREELLVRDGYRLEAWYAEHGHFDARFLGWEVEVVRPGRPGRAAVVDLVGHVDPGPLSTVGSVEIEGLDRVLETLGRSVLRHAPTQEGEPFELAAVAETRDTLLQRLRNAARPYARVEMEVEARPEDRQVDVRLRADPGIVGSVGPVTVTGNRAVPDRFALDATRLEEGTAYRFDELRAAQRRLFELGTFSVVAVEPDLSDPTRREVPIDVDVTESKFGTARLGVGFDYDGYLPVLRSSARVRHVNLLHELLWADFGVQAGVAVDLQAGAVAQGIPTWGVDLLVRDPRLFSQRVSLELATSVEQELYNGLWTYFQPQADLYVVWRYSDAVQLRIGPHAEQYVFLGEFGPSVQAAQQRLFGIEADEAFRYELTSLDQFAQWDFRDDPVRTSRGTWYSLFFRESFPLTASGYGFFKASGEARAYLPVRWSDAQTAFPLTLAGRAAGEVVAPFEPGGNIPLPERAFLGGPNSLRGFRANQVGPYTTLCTYETVDTRDGFLGLVGDPVTEEQVTRYHLPDGGTASAELGVEGRYDWIYGVLLSAFVDAGALSSDLGSLGPEDLRWSAGVGARYDTLVGPIRFDVSFRQLYPEDAGPTRYTQCRAGDEQPRVSDFFGNFGDLDRPPWAMVFYLTFGEAF